MTFSFNASGSTKHTEDFLRRLSSVNILRVLDSCGQDGVNALASATPKDTGRAASSWGYETSNDGGLYTISWTNTDIEDGFPVAIRLQFGHGTRTGGYVHGRDYINPAIKPVFDKIADRVWKAVTSA